MSIENSVSVFTSALVERIANARALTAAVSAVGTVIVMLGTALDRMLSAHERWRQRQALLALDDHLLKDIGVSRADVEHVVEKPFWRS